MHLYGSSLSEPSAASYSVSSSGSKPDRAEANEQDGRATDDQGKLLDPDVELANYDYVALQETKKQSEEAFEKLSEFNSSLVRRSVLRKLSKSQVCSRNNDGFLLLVCLV